MKFWLVTVFNIETNQEEQFKVAAPKSYTAAKIKKTFLEVHLEYQNICLKRIKKPAG